MTDQMTDQKPAPAPDAHPESRQGLLLPILLPLGSFAIIGVVLYGFSRVLLSITPHAATAVALIVAVSVMVVAIVVASRQRLSNGSLFSMVGSIAGIAMSSAAALRTIPDIRPGTWVHSWVEPLERILARWPEWTFPCRSPATACKTCPIIGFMSA